MARTIELTIPIKTTAEMWNRKYPLEFAELFKRCEDEGLLSLVLPPEITNKSEFMLQYLLSGYSHRIIKPIMTFIDSTDIAAINKMKADIYFVGRSIAHKYKAMSNLLYKNWNDELVEKLIRDYDITKTGNIDYLRNASNSHTSNTKINKSKEESSIYTFDNQKVSESESTTDPMSGTDPSGYAKSEAISNGLAADHTITTFNTVREYGSKGHSFAVEFEKFYEFINIDLLAEFIKDTSPAFLLQAWC